MSIAKRLIDSVTFRPSRITGRFFFDRKIVIDAADRGTRKVLMRFGAFVMTTARRSIKDATFVVRGKKARARSGITAKKISRPGRPPLGHTKVLRKSIFFDVDMDRRSVVIGPIRLGGKIGNAPEALEKSGESIVQSGRRGKRKTRRVHIRARPYMGPALKKNEPRLPAMWANSVKA